MNNRAGRNRSTLVTECNASPSNRTIYIPFIFSDSVFPLSYSFQNPTFPWVSIHG